MLKKKSRRSIAPDAISGKAPLKMRKEKGRVRFTEETPETKLVSRRTAGEHMKSWYNQKDYAAMKRNNQAAISSAKLGTFFESEYESIRGLERFVWFSPNEKQQRRRAAIARILSEQKRQRSLGINDPSMIKVLSSIYSNWERDRALELAAGDAIEVFSHHGSRQDDSKVVVAACRADAIETFAAGFDSPSVWL